MSVLCVKSFLKKVAKFATIGTAGLIRIITIVGLCRTSSLIRTDPGLRWCCEWQWGRLTPDIQRSCEVRHHKAGTGIHIAGGGKHEIRPADVCVSNTDSVHSGRQQAPDKVACLPDCFLSQRQLRIVSSQSKSREAALLYKLTVFIGQATILSAFYARSPAIVAQDGLNGDKAGSWFRFREFTGAVGPYCVALNKRLADYDNNFDTNGLLMGSKVPDICSTGQPINLNGLAYDVGHYCYARHQSTDPIYQQQGKR